MYVTKLQCSSASPCTYTCTSVAMKVTMKLTMCEHVYMYAHTCTLHVVDHLAVMVEVMTITKRGRGRKGTQERITAALVVVVREMEQERETEERVERRGESLLQVNLCNMLHVHACTCLTGS